MTTTIERLVERHRSEVGVDYHVNPAVAEPHTHPPFDAPLPARQLSQKGWAAVLGYSVIVFVCGVTLGYAVRDNPGAPAAPAFAALERDPAMLRIDYDLRVR